MSVQPCCIWKKSFWCWQALSAIYMFSFPSVRRVHACFSRAFTSPKPGITAEGSPAERIFRDVSSERHPGPSPWPVPARPFLLQSMEVFLPRVFSPQEHGSISPQGLHTGNPQANPANPPSNSQEANCSSHTEVVGQSGTKYNFQPDSRYHPQPLPLIFQLMAHGKP